MTNKKEKEFISNPVEAYENIVKQLARKTQECNELKIENEELNNRMAEVIYRATGGRLSYSNYTLDAIEQAFNDQLEILSDQKVGEEIKELNQKLYLVQNEVHFKTKYIQEQREGIKQLEQECEELKKTIKTIFKALIIANHKDIGIIQDTIWVDKITTLWDYIMITLDMNDDQFKEFEKQAIREMERIYE